MTCQTHNAHDHKHGAGCGHTQVQHGDHIDYLHENHMHHVHDDHIDEHAIAIGGANAAACTPDHACGGHESGHKHGPGCGHEGVPHGDHVDYLVSGHLHSPCGEHCDHHGALTVK